MGKKKALKKKSSKTRSVIFVIAALLVIAGILYYFYARDYILLSGKEIAEKNLDFIETLKKEDGDYYRFIDCINNDNTFECENVEFSEAYQPRKYFNLAIVNFVKYTLTNENRYKDEIKISLQKWMSLEKPDSDFRHMLRLIVDIINSGIFDNDPFEKELIDYSKELLNKKFHIGMYENISYADKDIIYYYNEVPSLPDQNCAGCDNNYPPTRLKSNIYDYGRLASAYAKAYTLEKDSPDKKLIYAAKNIVSHANLWYFNLKEDEKLDSEGLYKEKACYLVLAHMDLFESTGNNDFLEFPTEFFNSVDFNSIYSKTVTVVREDTYIPGYEDSNYCSDVPYPNWDFCTYIPYWAYDSENVLPCIDALQKLSKAKNDITYLNTAKKVANFLLTYSFDYPHTFGYMAGDGSIKKNYHKDTKKDLAVNAYSSYLFSNEYFRNEKFRITKK